MPSMAVTNSIRDRTDRKDARPVCQVVHGVWNARTDEFNPFDVFERRRKVKDVGISRRVQSRVPVFSICKNGTDTHSILFKNKKIDKCI